MIDRSVAGEKDRRPLGIDRAVCRLTLQMRQTKIQGHILAKNKANTLQDFWSKKRTLCTNDAAGLRGVGEQLRPLGRWLPTVLTQSHRIKTLATATATESMAF